MRYHPFTRRSLNSGWARRDGGRYPRVASLRDNSTDWFRRAGSRPGTMSGSGPNRPIAESSMPKRYPGGDPL